jgi:hypothetical protein
MYTGILAKETLAIAKDRFSEVAPEVAGKAGKQLKASYTSSLRPHTLVA